MKVEDLIRLLRRIPKGTIVILASDSYRDDYYPLEGIEKGWWQPGEGFGQFHETADATDPDTAWEPNEDSEPAVLLIPVETLITPEET